MPNIFTEHPHAVNETYLAHLSKAMRFAITLLVAGFACLIHAIFPFLFETTGSDFVRRLCEEMGPRADEVRKKKAAL